MTPISDKPAARYSSHGWKLDRNSTRANTEIHEFSIKPQDPASSVSTEPTHNGIDPADVAVLNLDNEGIQELIFEDGFETP